MRVWKRGRYYWYEFVFRGQRVEQSSRVLNKEDAKDIASAHRLAMVKRDAGIFEPTALTLDQFTERFLREVKATAASDDTVTFYTRRWTSLMKYKPLATAALPRVTKRLISDYIAWRRAQKSRRGTVVSVATVNRELATLRKALRMAAEWQLIGHAPQVKLLRGENERDFVLAAGDQARYLAALPARYRDLAALILETGLRAREACTLRWPQVQLDATGGSRAGFLRIVGKGRKKRAVPLTDAATALLRSLPRDGAYVFGGKRALRVDSFDHAHGRARRRQKFSPDFVVHSLRHTCLTRLGEAGADAFSIMRIAGHTSITVSQRYVHPSPAAVELAMLRLNPVAAKVPTGNSHSVASADVTDAI